MAFSLRNLLLPRLRRARLSSDQPVVLVGPEMAGGILVSQLIVADPSKNHPLPGCVEFAYLRKNRKKSGTKQQLEGSESLTSRTPNSPPMDAIWIDDVISTGGSLREGCELLKKDYNLNVKSALFLVDRSQDRKGTKNGSFPGLTVQAIFDNSDVERLVLAPPRSRL